MTLAQIKLYFRQKIKALAGGPTDLSGGTRGAGLLAALDALADKAVVVPLQASELDGDRPLTPGWSCARSSSKW